MKNYKQGSVIQIVIVLIAVAIAGVGLYMLQKEGRHALPHQNATSTPITATTTVDTTTWKSRSFNEVTFKYPSDWTVVPQTGTGANAKIVVTLTLVPPNKVTDNDVIVIGGNKLTCVDLNATHTCKEAFTIPVYTKSTSTLIISVLNAVATSATK